MRQRGFIFLGGLVALLLATTAVTTHYLTAQESDYFTYLPLVTRAPETKILSFTVEPDTVDPGETVTLSWEVQDADQVVLTRYWDFRPAEWWEDLPLMGTFTYTVPLWERNPIIFTLYAEHTETGVSVGDGVTIHVICPDTWFFNPPPGGCPSEPLYSPAAEQAFEGGVMIWVGEQDRIIVLFADTQYPKVSNFSDDWDGGEICDLGPPPAGRVHPVNGFGYLWCQNQAVRDRLGWGLEPEIGYQTILQWTTMVKYNHSYLRAADGNVWHLLPESSGWEKIIVEP
jgi:hypothetical protein